MEGKLPCWVPVCETEVHSQQVACGGPEKVQRASQGWNGTLSVHAYGGWYSPSRLATLSPSLMFPETP